MTLNYHRPPGTGEDTWQAWTNAEMYDYILGPNKNVAKTELSHLAAQKRWHDLYQFAQKNNFLGKKFNGNTQKHFHECYWELLVAKKLSDRGLNVSRIREKEGKTTPDFSITEKGLTFFVEAVACGDAAHVNMTPCQNDEFESGYVDLYEAKLKPRLKKALDGKFDRYPMNRPLIIAVNAYKSLNCRFDFVDLQERQLLKKRTALEELLFSCEVGTFSFSHQDSGHILGVLYSTACVFTTETELCPREFFYIPNPICVDYPVLKDLFLDLEFPRID